MRGSVRRAEEQLRAAVAQLDTHDALGWRCWALSLLAEACALRGKAAEARSFELEASNSSTVALRIFDHDSSRGQAWAITASGDVSRAAKLWRRTLR